LLDDGLGVGVFGENMARPLIIFWIFREKNKKEGGTVKDFKIA
jgi:hypothetical protein